MAKRARLYVKYEGLDEILEMLGAARSARKVIEAIVKQRGSELQQKAQYYVPVDTAYLQRSIELWIEKNDGISANVEPKAYYATFVEFGTRKMASQPYMRPAFYDIEPKFKQDIEEFLAKLLENRLKGFRL